MSPITSDDGASARAILPMGDRAILVDVGSLEAVQQLHAQLVAARIDGVVDLVPAARTVLIRVDPTVLALAAARAWIAAASTDSAAPAEVDRGVVELAIAYDGPDLAETAGLLGIEPAELVRRHSSAEWTVAFTGFAPGFGYLVSPDWPFGVPRLSSPRTRVPRGAVGLAAAFSGAYPRESPGGWRLIGATTAPLFEPEAADAASAVLLTPGTRVRFREVASTSPRDRETASERRDRGVTPMSRPPDAVSRPSAVSRPDAVSGSDVVARVLEPGLLATVQDLGRGGLASLGVATSGALDRGALRTANRLIGNPEDAAAIEVTMGGLRAIAERDVWLAVAGAWGRIRLAGREVDPYASHLWRAGEELHLDWFAHGVRAYLALRGGIAVPQVLGSRATDLLAGLGPVRLEADDVLTIGAEPAHPVPAAALAPWGAPHDDEMEIALAAGPRTDWFTPTAVRTLFESVWTVTNDSDRVGMRLDGPELERVEQSELPSEGMVAGALQVPPSGRPTILLADGPVTGGYPVIAVVADASLDLLAQARPGTLLRFRHARQA